MKPRLSASLATMLLSVTGLLGADRSPDWPKVRRAHLALEPACAVCYTTNNLEVHHITPYHIRPELELVETNLITLCDTPGASCHFNFGHLGSWTNWNLAIRSVAGFGAVSNREATNTTIATITVADSLAWAGAAVTNGPRLWAVSEVVDRLREQGDMTNLVMKLLNSGDLCAALGHKWESARKGRSCVLCGKNEP